MFFVFLSKFYIKLNIWVDLRSNKLKDASDSEPHVDIGTSYPG